MIHKSANLTLELKITKINGVWHQAP